MPVSTWTPTTLASESRRWKGSGWRAVEAQHKNATMNLVHGNVADQTLLEQILEEVKPELPEEAKGLHWLLMTPFRYRPPLPAGSRFRRRTDPGVFYGAEDRETSCAESGYWRLRVWLDSKGLSAQPATVPVTLFQFKAATGSAIDLTRPPLSADEALWTAQDDYSGTHALAENARAAAIEVIRYASVRNPGGRCLALLSPEPFRNVPAPCDETQQQTWNLFIKAPDLTVWQRPLNGESFSFTLA